MNPTRNDLPESVRKKMVALLNERLADAIDLQDQAKQAHWNVKGPNFIALHELFDAVSEAVGEHVDIVAERAVALGGIVEGTVQAVHGRTSLKPYPLKITAAEDHLNALSDAIAALGKLAREAIDASDKAGDADTADVFTAFSRELDKQLWFVEAHLN